MVETVADVNAAFATWLKNARESAGLKQREVADAMRAQGFEVFIQTTVAKSEAGDRPIRLDEAAALAALFGSTLDAVLGLKSGTPPIVSASKLFRRTALLQSIRQQIDAELGGDS